MLYIHQTLLSSSSVEGGSEDETRLYIDPNTYIWQLECCVVAYRIKITQLETGVSFC